MEIKQYQPAVNLKKIEGFTRKAKMQGADVVIFPEDCITGPVIGKKKFVDHKGLYKTFFQKLAIKHSIDIVTGSFIEGIKQGWYNSSYYINSNGEILGNYHKNNLWHPERWYLKPGIKSCVFDTKFGKAGIIICWDLIFPEIFREMVKKGVQIIYCPSYWCFEDVGSGKKFETCSEVKLVDSACTLRAFENEIVFVYTNAAGQLILPEYKSIDNLLGRSQITVPFKGILNKLDHNEEEMFVQKVDTGILQVAEKVYKIRKDLQSWESYRGLVSPHF